MSGSLMCSTSPGRNRVTLPSASSLTKVSGALLRHIDSAFQRRLLMDQFRSLLCNLIDQPILPTDWIALNHDQVDLFLSNGGAA
jgi:hypothetical protein